MAASVAALAVSPFVVSAGAVQAAQTRAAAVQSGDTSGVQVDAAVRWRP